MHLPMPVDCTAFQPQLIGVPKQATVFDTPGFNHQA